MMKSIKTNPNSAKGPDKGDISFKLKTKIMNFMSVFFEKNIIKSTQVLSIICNTICLQFSLYRAPLQSLGLFLLISYDSAEKSY
jgi:hypothetical protein